LSGEFLKSCWEVASRRVRIFAFLNLAFFGLVFVAVFLMQFLLSPPLYSGSSSWVYDVFLGNWFLMVVGIFAFNLALSAFVVVTLPGVVFFPLSVGVLLYRGVLWSLLVYVMPSWLFLAVLPTLVLEGEAYIVAAVAGTIVGVSWIKPAWLYREEGLSRVDGFKKGFRECLRLYVLVVALLFVAAVVETAAIVYVYPTATFL
jgi:hypothetical protein